MKEKDLKYHFLENLKKYYSTHNPEIATIYCHLFEMFSDEAFEEKMKYLYHLKNGDDGYFKEDGKTQWFAIFHKSIRQTDFFDDIYRRVKYPILTKDEISELRGLRHDLSIGKIQKSGTGDLRFTDEYRRLLHLASIQRRECADQSVTGNIDMILWNTINLDKNNVLLNSMIMFFEEDIDFSNTPKAKEWKSLN